MGLVTYIHPYIHTYNLHTFLYDGCCAGKRETCRLAGWLAAFGEPAKRPRDLVHTSPVPLSLSIFPPSLSSPDLFSFPRWPCETVRAPGVGCTPPPPPWPIDDSLLGHYRSGE